jgi:hypothetical protein
VPCGVVCAHVKRHARRRQQNHESGVARSSPGCCALWSREFRSRTRAVCRSSRRAVEEKNVGVKVGAGQRALYNHLVDTTGQESFLSVGEALRCRTDQSAASSRPCNVGRTESVNVPISCVHNSNAQLQWKETSRALQCRHARALNKCKHDAHSFGKARLKQGLAL